MDRATRRPTDAVVDVLPQGLRRDAVHLSERQGARRLRREHGVRDAERRDERRGGGAVGEGPAPVGRVADGPGRVRARAFEGVEPPAAGGAFVYKRRGALLQRRGPVRGARGGGDVLRVTRVRAALGAHTVARRDGGPPELQREGDGGFGRGGGDSRSRLVDEGSEKMRRAGGTRAEARGAAGVRHRRAAVRSGGAGGDEGGVSGGGDAGGGGGDRERRRVGGAGGEEARTRAIRVQSLTETSSSGCIRRDH
mmetsp:Transcript_4091/g.15189  ORF Transcript_4091/g.15189 Transcript_4091/m.15189 type:complete len:252 (+) Transcript_4091:882-1637(+)